MAPTVLREFVWEGRKMIFILGMVRWELFLQEQEITTHSSNAREDNTQKGDCTEPDDCMTQVLFIYSMLLLMFRFGIIENCL